MDAFRRSVEIRIEHVVNQDSKEVEADRYLNSKKAARSKGLGVKVAKIVPPGAE